MINTENKKEYLKRLSDDKGIISALAFDQRGALKKMIGCTSTEEPTVSRIWKK